MKTLRDLPGILAFRQSALRLVASRQEMVPAFLFFSGGYLAFKLVENAVYAEIQGPAAGFSSFSFLDSFLRLNFVQALLFLSLVYVPSVVCLSNAIAGEGLGLTMSTAEYRSHIAVLLPLWGALLLLTAPVPLVLPQVILTDFGLISVRFIIFLVLTVFYTIWAIRELNHISSMAAVGAFVLSWCTLPVFYILIQFLSALPFFIMFPVVYVLFQRYRSYFSSRESEKDFHRHLQELTLNPQDADAQYQLGLLHMKRGNLDSAAGYFERAIKIDPGCADYHYWLGRVWESRGDWHRALEEYEETYRINPEQSLGDIFREVGKAYLHTGNLDKAAEFLEFFLETRGSDPEGRFWFAVTFQKLGKPDDMRVQLNTILEQARSNPKFFRKGNRQWILRARRLLKGGIL